MKRFLYTLTAFALFATSCNNDNLGDNISLENKTTISVEAIGDDSRTYVENDQIFWSESGEKLNIIYFNDVNSSRTQVGTNTDYTVVDNRASFTANFYATEGATTYTLGAYSPYITKYSTASISLDVPAEQTPTESSYDKAADILVSKEPVVVNGTPESVQFVFARMVAIVKMTIKGIPAGEKISKITFSSPAKPVGSVTFKVHEPATLDNAVWYNNYEDITLNMDDRVATGEDVVWFTTVPTNLSGTSFKVLVETDKNNYVKEVDLTGKTLNFERADIAKFTVKDLAIQEKPKAYKLLTDIAELNAGDKVVICNRNYETTNAKFLSTTITGSYQNYISATSAISISSDIEILEDNLPADAAVFTLEAGETAGTFALKDATKNYLYATRAYHDAAYDTINILGFNDSKVAGTSWKIELDSNGAKMSTCYDGTNSRYLNGYSGSQYNAAASRSTSYKYYIFYIDGESSEGGEGGETPEQPVVTPLATPVVTANVTGNSVVVSWGEIAGAKNYTVTYGTTSFNTAETTVTLNLEYATEYTISVVANPADSTANSASEAGSVTVTTDADPNQGGGEVVSLTLPVEGAVGGATANTFYEGDITISSTGSWRIQGVEYSDWSGLFLGSGKSINVAVVDSSKHEITKVEMTAEAGGTLNFGSIGSGSSVTWEPGYGSSSKTFSANGSTRVASITVYYQAK